jgi:hypothetical protein
VTDAMEEHHTAILREMLQDILGEDYSEVAGVSANWTSLLLFS